MLKLYSELADWYLLLTAPEDYEEEAGWYAKVLREHAKREVRTVLELGCGPGANASFMKQWFQMTLVDLSPDMLRLAEQLNPGLDKHVGDMRTFRTDRKFDAVFIHDAICYMTTEEDLRAAVRTAAAHLEPGGVALLCPDDLQENFTPGTESGGHDAPDGRGVRYFMWSQPGPEEHTVATDCAYMLRHPDGRTDIESERHITGRFPKKTWLDAMKAEGLDARVLPLQHTEVAPGSHHVLVGMTSG